MKILLVLLLATTSVFAQTDCEDFLQLLGRREINEHVVAFKRECGPFEESFNTDANSKTLTSLEKGISITMVNTAKDQSVTPKYEVFIVELTSFTGKGGYKEEWPFGFKMGMDHKMVKKHIKGLKDVTYDKSDIGRKRSYFNYTGKVNDSVKDRQVRVYVSQYDGTSITSLRMRLK